MNNKIEHEMKESNKLEIPIWNITINIKIECRTKNGCNFICAKKKCKLSRHVSINYNRKTIN